MKAWRRDSIGAIIALSFVVAMGLGYALHEVIDLGLPFLGLPVRQPEASNIGRAVAIHLPARIATLITALDATPRADRPAIIEASQGQQIHVDLRDLPFPGLVDQDEQVAQALRRRVTSLLKTPHAVTAGHRNWQLAQVSAEADNPWRGGLHVQAQLTDGQWLHVATTFDGMPKPDPVAARFSRTSLVAWLALSAMLAIVLSVFAARRLANPLSELAAAVEQIAGNGDGPPLPVRGPHELRVTIDAINRMQDRLHRFVADRTQMLAAMSHDLRTPLTRLRLRLELMEDQDQAQKMLRELDTMFAMVESTLSFARDDTKREPRTLTDLSALVEGICDDAVDAGANVTFSGDRGITFLCRPTALRRAISNLVDNAVKYGGSALVSLRSESGRVVITIEDDGPGIPPSQREKVFEPFYRLDASRNPETGGVGLGLSVARSIAREHGGDVTLASRKGGGLNVRLELPGGAAGSVPASPGSGVGTEGEAAQAHAAE